MSYHNLNNEEIVFLYFVAKNVTRQYEEVHKQRELMQSVPSEFGLLRVSTPLPEDLLDEMLKSEHYIFMKSIQDKLKDIVELIAEVEPELHSRIANIFTPPKNK